MKLTSIISTFLLSIGITSQAQVSTFLPDAGLDLVIDGDYLYHVGVTHWIIYRVDISDPMLPIIFPIDDTDESDYIGNSGVSSLGVNGTDLYMGLVGIVPPEDGASYKLDLTNLAADAEMVSGNLTLASDFAFKNDVLYTGDTYLVDSPLWAYNVAGGSPASPTSYVARNATALDIDGFTMYFAASEYDGGTGTLYDGEIFEKNMLVATPEVSLVTANGVVLDVLRIDDYLYFTDDDGLKRFNVMEAVPSVSLIAANADYGTIRKIQHKAYSNGASCLFATETDGERIIKIDLNAIVTSTIAPDKEAQFKLYPNPAQDELTISSNATIKNITVFDVTGRTVRTVAANGAPKTKTVQVANLPAGFYLLQVETTSAISTSEFVKN